jgi:microcystin-dependent protein
MTRAEKLIQTINGLLTTGSGITASKHRDVEASIVNFAASQWVTGDLKMIDCTNDYIIDNFEPNGKGKVGGPREGWAICNGNNLTMNRTGRVPMGWGNVTSTDGNGWDIRQFNMKNPDGTPVAWGNNGEALTVTQMPSHTHDFQIRQDSSSSGNYLTLSDTKNSDEGTWGTDSTNTRILANGGGAAHNNVQPSMVTLFIQKIDEV